MVTVRRLEWSTEAGRYVALTDAWDDRYTVLVGPATGWVDVLGPGFATPHVSYPPNVILEVVWDAA